jgi:hypothetical protein
MAMPLSARQSPRNQTNSGHITEMVNARGDQMGFTVVSPLYDARHEDGVLRGVADGLSQLFPVLDCPGTVFGLDVARPQENGAAETSDERLLLRNEALHTA